MKNYNYNSIEDLKKDFCKEKLQGYKESIHYFAFQKLSIIHQCPYCEDIIKKNARCSYLYAKYVLRSRFSKGEDVILNDRYWTLAYAIYVVQKRWPEGEKAVLKNIYTNVNREIEIIVYYSINVKKRRWKKIEKFIKEDEKSWKRYVGCFPDACE